MDYFDRKTLFCATLFIFALFSSNVGMAATAKADPGSNATWSGKGGIDSGRENFAAWCTNCHGTGGLGDGVLSDSLGEGLKPRNLTDASVLSTRTDEQLYNVIRNGGSAEGFSDAMMSHAAMLTDDEIKNVILYIRAEICKCKYTGK